MQLAGYLAALVCLGIMEYAETGAHLDSPEGQRLLVLGLNYKASVQTCLMWKLRRYLKDLASGLAAPPTLDCEKLKLCFIWQKLRAAAGRLAGRGIPSSLLHPDRVSVCTAADGRMPGIVDLPGARGTSAASWICMRMHSGQTGVLQGKSSYAQP